MQTSPNKVFSIDRPPTGSINTNQVAPEELPISPEDLDKLDQMVHVEPVEKKESLRPENEIEMVLRGENSRNEIEENQQLFKFEEKDSSAIEAAINKFEKNIAEHNPPDQKKVFFVLAVVKAEKELAELFRTKILDVSLSNNFTFNTQNREDIRSHQEIISNVLKTCVSCSLPNISKEILKLSNYYKCDDELIKLCIDNDFFSLLSDLLKKTKEYLQDQTKKNYSSSSRFSQMQSYKTQFLQSLSMTIQNVMEKNALFWLEHDRANDNIEKCLLRKEERIAKKLLVYYFIKFTRNFIKYTVLDFAISNECYLFVKKYFNIYPKTRYRIRDFNTINHIVEILDDDDSYLHGIFLLSKVNTRTLNEIHVRMIIDRYWLFLRDKLMLITYTLNPILVCVQIIENLKSVSRFFANVRIKLKTIIDEFLKLAFLIAEQITDEIILKTILLKVFYPSQIPLLKILYSDKNFYVNLLKSELISNIVSKLWFCQYNWTFNFLNSSSAYKNLVTHFGNEGSFINPQAWRFRVSKMVAGGKQSEKKKERKRASLIQKDDSAIDYSMKPIGLMVYNKTPNGGFVGIADFAVNLNHPFEFYKKTRFSKEIRMYNHIFSYFFFENSPACKVVIEFIVYMIFFAVIIWNMFQVFADRRYFDKTDNNLLNFADGLLATSEEKPGTPLFYQILANYSLTHNYTQNETYESFYGLDHMGISEKVLPWLGDQIPEFYQKTTDVWDTANAFWLLNIYFFTTFLQDLFEIIFYYKKMKKIALTGKFWIDLVLFGINIYIFVYYFKEIDSSHLVVQNDLIYKFTYLERVLTLFIFIMWFKFIVYLKLTKRFGIVVKVIENMSVRLGIFMIVLCIVILAFASVCYYLFDQPDPVDFSSFWGTLQTLIVFLFGNVDLSNFTSQRLLAGIVLNIYSFLTYVLLLNLIIAILSSDFAEVSERGNLENANTLYFHYQMRKTDKYLSLLSSMAPPFNVLVLLFLPFLLYKRSSKLNKIGTIIGFVIYSLFFTTFYALANILLVIPLCYIRLFFTLIINIIIKRKFYKKGTIVWLLWVFLGNFYMLWVFLVHDLPLFFKSMYYPCLIKDRLDEITMEEVMLIDSQCEALISSGKDFITHGELTESIKTDLERINKKFRRNSLLQQRNKAWNILQTLIGKGAESIGISKNSPAALGSNSNTNSPGLKRSATIANLGENIENEINVFVEIDKMEVFSFLRQFNGINGMIDVKRLRFLIAQIKLCKKFNLMKISKTKQNKLINVIQVVEMLPVEKSVVSIIGEQVRNSKIFENVLKKFIC